MLQIFSDGHQIDLFQDMKFNLNFINPLFLNDLQGSYAYELQFPLTDNNKKHLINYLNRIETPKRSITPYLQIFFNGIKLAEGSYIIRNITSAIVGSLAAGNGNLLYEIKGRYLNEFDFGGKTFGSALEAQTYFNSNIDNIFPEVDFCMPMISSRDAEGNTADIFLPAEVTNFIEKDILNYYDTENSTYRVLDPDAIKIGGIIVPHLFLRFVLNKIFNTFGYSHNDLFFQDDDYKRLTIWNIYNTNHGIPELSEDMPGYTSPRVQNIIYNNHLPKVLITEFLAGLQNLLNVRFFIDHNKKKVSSLDADQIITNPEYIDITSKILKLTDKEIINYDGFSLKETPDNNDKWYQYKSELAETLFSNRYLGVFDNFAQFPSVAENNAVAYIKSEKIFYEYQTIPADWAKLSDLDTDLISSWFNPNSEFEIESKLSTLLNDPDNSYISVQGYDAYDYKSIPARIFYYNGLDGDYPSSRYWRGTKYLNYYNLYLYRNRWENYINLMLNNSFVSMNVLLSPGDLATLDFSKKYRALGIDYLVKSVKVPITSKSILPSTIECYKV